MLVLFRLDANAALGAGHLMRCRALARALRARGVEVGFALAATSTERALALADEGFAVELVPTTEPGPLDAADLASTIAVADRLGADSVVVDHYGAGPEYLDGLADAGFTVGVVDDLADRDLSAARWILNQSLGAPALSHPAVTTALGVCYALLRPEFAEVRAGLRRTFGQADAHVLVTLGGGETTSLALTVVEALETVTRALEVRVVVGSGPAPGVLVRAAGSSRHRVEVHCAVRSVAPLMAWADVSVNAGGSTCWELACLGVPMLVVALSPDQQPNAAALAAAGAAVELRELGDAAPVVERLLDDPERRRAMSAVGSALVDGLGARRAAESLLSLLEVAGAAH